ncbi:Crp/Fnr family transcriptional regulator [Fluviicola sp.]|jgi:CRP-like cAMP-binding protein|uniref:Crp/Fnr family transcriptional regulator n=1 Tax=Fluviicola sp. TaxID=1917219 RepID=UPI002830B815|nr:Crp/Fnr family transcriptional regulator [Fluviicola sp.]MDR0801910.1 Crp/Fnr family transcriptional regulator [Fluviicola sp.]
MHNVDFPYDQFSFISDSIFTGLPESDLMILKKNMITHNYRKNEIIFREGTYPNGIFLLNEGRAKKYKTDKNGKEQIFYICKNGELLGYHALVSGEKYFDSACAMESSIISFIPKDDFFKVLNESSILKQRLLKAISHEFGVLVNFIILLAQRTVRERLALSLLILRDKFKPEIQKTPVELNISREDLSKFVGTARETLGRLLHDFKEEGLITINGRIIILKNPDKLSKIANIL